MAPARRRDSSGIPERRPTTPAEQRLFSQPHKGMNASRSRSHPPRKCSHRFTTRSRRRGFTLLEMLFVVLIIAILALLVLPVLGKAQARAKSVACSSQLRQVGIAMHDFSHEH